MLFSRLSVRDKQAESVHSNVLVVFCLWESDAYCTARHHVHGFHAVCCAGRTGRAGRAGRAITLYTEEDKDSLRSVAHLIAASGTEVPAWMLALPKVRKNRKRPRKVEEKHSSEADDESS